MWYKQAQQSNFSGLSFQGDENPLLKQLYKAEDDYSEYRSAVNNRLCPEDKDADNMYKELIKELREISQGTRPNDPEIMQKFREKVRAMNRAKYPNGYGSRLT